MFFTDTNRADWLIAQALLPRTAAADRLAVAAYRGIKLFDVWVERIRMRRELARLDDRMLEDIGLNRIVADREANKSFWQA